jgi:hypothetical protein
MAEPSGDPIISLLYAMSTYDSNEKAALPVVVNNRGGANRSLHIRCRSANGSPALTQ